MLFLNMERPGRLRLILVLSLALAAVSCGSLFIRLASAPALAIAAYRVLLATLILSPWVLSGPIREIRPLSRIDWGWLLLAGTALALHFALWIASLSYTSVSSSVVLVNTTPFFVGLATQWFLKNPPGRSFWLGLTLAFAGCLVIFRGDFSESHDTIRGNLLAVGGAIAMALYLLAGARAQMKLSLLAYVWPVYGSAAAVLILACTLSQTPLWGFEPVTYLNLFLLALVPQCIGHTSYNWALRWLSPALVALVSLLEPLGATLLAYIFLNEAITWEKFLGGGIILAGVYIATNK
jgi:drug/metabolite transporter (DMT)-like permease